jgi:hypothetical protein
MILKNPLSCTYYKMQLPDKYNGKDLSIEESQSLFMNGEIEEEKIGHSALIIRFDLTTITDGENHMKSSFVTATIVDIKTGEMQSKVEIDSLVLDSSAVNELKSISL